MIMATNPAPVRRQKPANISNPPKFSGKREDLEGFKNIVNIKLMGNAEQFPSDQHCLAYVYGRVINHAIESEFPAPVSYLPMFPSISTTLLVEIRLGYVLLAYSLWYLVIYFGNAL